MRAIAKQLIAAESPASNAPEKDDAAAFPATDKLRPHLSTLMGRNGFQALLARALVLGTPEIAWLSAVRVVTSGELEGLSVAQAKFGAANISEGEIVVLAQLLGLLVAFIGPALTARLISQLWPHLSLTDADFAKMPT
jgi:hypothetical protein